MPMSPDYLQLAMEQCQLKLNELGELVPTDIKSPYSFLSATLGFQVLQAMLTALDLGVAKELHTLVAQLQGEIGGTGSLALVISTAFSSFPSLVVGLCSPSPHMTFAKLSTLLEAVGSNWPQVLLLHPSVFENLLCVVCYVYVLVLCSGFKFCYRPRRENVLPH